MSIPPKIAVSEANFLYSLLFPFEQLFRLESLETPLSESGSLFRVFLRANAFHRQLRAHQPVRVDFADAALAQVDELIFLHFGLSVR